MNKISDTLKDKLNNIPELPGIHKMLDSKGNIIYIGKSISLRQRVRSYFTGSPKWGKIERMVELIEEIEYEVMDTHLEARLEECRLIKELQPIFNSQFKNDRKYVYLKLEDYNIHNSLSISYERLDNSFGPFRSRSFTMDLIDDLKNLYPIIKVEDKYDFEYNLMPKSMDRDIFNRNRDSLNQIFSDDEDLDLFINELEEKMKEASSSLRFEMAAYYKALIDNFNYIKRSLFKYRKILSKDILLNLDIENGHKLFYISKGQIIFKEKYDKLDDRDIVDFIKRSKEMLPLNIHTIDEKINMDFLGILYSEIKSLPEEKVLIQRGE